MTPIEGPDGGLNAAVAAELRAERAAQSLTVQQLSERADVPYASLRRYLAAERHIDVSTLDALAKALGTTPVDLVMAAAERLSRAATGNVVDIRDRKSSDEPSSLEHLKGLPSAAAPKRRDTGEGDDDA